MGRKNFSTVLAMQSGYFFQNIDFTRFGHTLGNCETRTGNRHTSNSEKVHVPIVVHSLETLASLPPRTLQICESFCVIAVLASDPYREFHARDFNQELFITCS